MSPKKFMSSNIVSNSDFNSSDLRVDLKKFPIQKVKISKEDMIANDQRMEQINLNRDSS